MNVKMNLRKKSATAVLISLGTITIFNFQNCSGGFAVKDSVKADLAAQMSSPKIDFTIATPNMNGSAAALPFSVALTPGATIASVTCVLSATTASGTTTTSSDCKSGSFSVSNLSDGLYALNIQAITTAGVRAEATQNFSIDRTPPTLTVLATPSVDSNVARPEFTFTASDLLSGVGKTECALDAASFVACASPLKSATDISEGTHTLKVRITDKAGNISGPYSFSWNVELTNPSMQIASNVGAFTKATTAALTFSSNRTVTYDCRLDAATFAPCVSPVNLANLANGAHRFEARAKSKAGNVSDVSAVSWTVDSVPPLLSVSMTPPLNSNQTQPQFSFSSSDASSGVDKVDCALDAGNFAPCVSPYKPAAALAEGSHSLKIRITDKAGNESVPYNYVWNVELSKPTVSITSTAATFTSSNSATIRLSGDKMVSFECRLDVATFAACADVVNYTNLSAGAHKFEAKGTTSAGNTSDVVALSWTIDMTAPLLIVTAAPAANSNVATPDFVFTTSDASSGIDRSECRIDSSSYVACSSPYRPQSLAEGSHTVKIHAFDKAGNESAVYSLTWNVELTRPTLQLAAAPLANSTVKSGSFTISSSKPVATYEVSIDSVPVIATTSTISYTNLSEGAHVFKAKVYTSAGNASEQLVFNWTIDSQAPSVPVVVAGVSVITNSSTASFAFTSTDSGSGVDHFACSVDSATPSSFTNCDSPKMISSVAEGAHQFYVKAIDRAGNASNAASSSWSVDLTPPTTPQLTLDISAVTNSTSVTAAFAATDANSGLGSYTCAIDSSVTANCVSPFAGSGLADGNHNFVVYAFDRAGNRSTASSKDWFVDSTPPSVTITSVNGSSTALTSADFNMVIADSGSGLMNAGCRIDAQAESPCTTAAHFDGVVDGDHTFFVRATDKAGNVTNKSYMWTVTGPLVHPHLMGTIFKNRAVDAPNDDYQLRFGIPNANISSILFSPTYTDWGQADTFGDSGRVCFQLNNGDLMCAGLGTVSDEFDLDPNLVNTPQLVAKSVKKSVLTRNGICIIKTDSKMKCLISRILPSKVNRVVAQFTADNVVDIKAGVDHQCYLVSNGELFCWGKNGQGQLATGNTVNQTSPVRSLTGVAQFSVLFGATCGVSNGNLVCVGSSQYFRFGDVQQLSSPVVIQSPFLGDTLVGGVGVMTPLCWLKGSDLNCTGQNGFGTWDYADPNHFSVAIGGFNYFKGAKKVVSSYMTECAINLNNDAYCFGRDSNRGAIGSTYLPYGHSTELQLQLRGVADVYLSPEMSCFKMISGEFRCMGQITGDKQDPSPMSNGLTWDREWTKIAEGAEKIALKYSHGCYIDSNQKLTCWGDNVGGQIYTADVLRMTELGSVWLQGTKTFPFKVKDVAVGQSYTCALTDAGDITCWGLSAQDVTGFYNSNPANFTNTESIPSLANYYSTGYFTRNDLRNVKAIAGAESSVCVITADDRVACWGAGGYDIFQDGKQGSDARFFDVGGATKIFGGQAHFCAINRANEVYCWGFNHFGQVTNDPSVLGDFVTVPLKIATSAVTLDLSPTQTCIYKSGSDIECRGKGLDGLNKQVWKHAQGYNALKLAFDGAGGHNCIVNSENKLYCGGPATYGVFGAGASTAPSVLAEAGSGLSVTDAKIGYQGYSMCVLDVNKRVYCRGLNWHGMTGRNAYYNFPRTVNFQ